MPRQYLAFSYPRSFTRQVFALRVERGPGLQTRRPVPGGNRGTRRTPRPRILAFYAFAFSANELLNTIVAFSMGLALIPSPGFSREHADTAISTAVPRTLLLRSTNLKMILRDIIHEELEWSLWRRFGFGQSTSRHLRAQSGLTSWTGSYEPRWS